MRLSPLVADRVPALESHPGGWLNEMVRLQGKYYAVFPLALLRSMRGKAIYPSSGEPKRSEEAIHCLTEETLWWLLPAYNAAGTLRQTYEELPFLTSLTRVLLVDDRSPDETVDLARELNVIDVPAPEKFGLREESKNLLPRSSQERGGHRGDVASRLPGISPKLVTSLAGMIASGHYDVALGSRILGVGALKGGMPRYKYVSNRFLTAVQNLLLGYELVGASHRISSVLIAAACWSRCHSEETGSDFTVSITKCWLRRFISIMGSGGECACPTRKSFAGSILYQL